MLKPLLREFLTWLEGRSMGVCQPGSPFDQPLDPGALAEAQEAVELAQASGGDLVFDSQAGVGATFKFETKKLHRIRISLLGDPGNPEGAQALVEVGAFEA